MACISEGEVPASANRYQLTGSEDDAGITARLAKKLVAWTSQEAGRLEVIRPGTFTTEYIRSTGLRSPVLIKGDRFNESPQLGLMLPDLHNISVDVLSDYIGGDRKVDTWDVVKQRPGPAWTLSQWCTYWHARLDAATRQARPATAHGAPGMLINEEDDEEGEVVDSGVVIVLQGVQGAPHSRYNPAPACVGISPEQAQRLLDGECLPLHGSQLYQHIRPPPAIMSVDLVAKAEREMKVLAEEVNAKNREAAALFGKSDIPRASAAAAETSRDGSKRIEGGKKLKEITPVKFPAPSVNPCETLHLQMTPKDCFSDFRMAPGGAATWLYVLQGVKVVVLIPPTLRNRRLFLTWATATRANQPKENVLVECFLADYAEGALKVEVKASQGLVIPAGWFYASATTTDTLAVGCFFWHPYGLADSARVQQMELQLKLKPQRFSLPARMLLWYAGVAYCFKMRKELGLPDLMLKQPGQHNSALHSVSEASLNQQQRVSPYLRGLPGPAAGSEQQQRRRLVPNAGGSATPSNTPPLLGMQAPGHPQVPESFSGLMESPLGHRNKRGRQADVMEQLYLGDAAVPVDAAAAATGDHEGQPQQQQQLKRLRLANGKPTTPLLAGVAVPGAVGVTASAISTPRSSGRPLQQTPSAAAVVPCSSNQSGRLLRHQNGAGAGPDMQHQQQLHTPRGRGKYAVMDDDDEGECHTSPVRKAEPGPVDDAAAAAGDGYVQWKAKPHEQQQRGFLAASDTARPITTLKIRVPGKSQPLYSPVVQPMKGDLDSIPPLEQQQPAAVTPTTAAARRGTLLPPPATAGAAGTATPGRKKLTLKGQVTPTAAAAAAAGGNVVWPGSSTTPAAATQQLLQQQPVRRKSSPEQESSAGSHAVSAEGTHTSGGQQQQQQQQQHGSVAAAAIKGHHTQHCNGLPEPTRADEGAEQQLGHQHEQEQVAARADQAPQLPRHVTAGAAPQQRRVSDSGAPRPVSTTAAAVANPAAAGAPAAMKAPMRLKFKLASQSPKLAVLPAPQAGSGAPPALSLDAPPAALQQHQQQQEGSTPGLQEAAVLPQVDGATAGSNAPADGVDVEAVVSQGQLAMQKLLHKQQQQQHQQPRQQDFQLIVWARWRQLQGQVHAGQQHNRFEHAAAADAAAATACMIPQVDGAVDDGRPVIVGPTLVLQPAAAAAITAVTSQPLAAAAAQRHSGYGGRSGTAPSGVAPATGFLPPVSVQQQLQVPLQVEAHAAVRPPAVRQQEQQPLAAAPTHLTQHGLVLTKNPVLQPQVHKLRLAAAAKASSPDASSPRDKAPSPRLAGQQLQHGHVGTSAVGSPAGRGPGVASSAAGAGPSADLQVAGARGLQDAPSLVYWTDQTPEQAPGDVEARAATAAGDLGGFSRAGSCNSPALLGATAPVAVAAVQAPAAVLRRSSVGVMGESTAMAIPRFSPPAFTAAAEGANDLLVQPGAAAPQSQQQQGVMGPPPPTRLSGWEVLGLPMLIELLQEQVMDKVCETPHMDPDIVVQQLHETVMEASRREKKQLDGRAALATAAEQQAAGEPSKQQQQQVTAVGEVEMQQLQQERGMLAVSPLLPDEMPPGFLEHCRLGQQLLRANGALPGLGGGLGGQHDTTTEVVGDHDPHEGSVGAGSVDNRSVGSIGGSRGAGPAGAAAAGAGGGDVGRAGRLGAAVGGRHQQVKRAPETLGLQQAKNLKKKQLLKGIGIKR